MATHSSIPAWKIPWTEEPGRLQSKRVAESDTTECTHECYRSVDVKSPNQKSPDTRKHETYISALRCQLRYGVTGEQGL